MPTKIALEKIGTIGHAEHSKTTLTTALAVSDARPSAADLVKLLLRGITERTDDLDLDDYPSIFLRNDCSFFSRKYRPVAVDISKESSTYFHSIFSRKYRPVAVDISKESSTYFHSIGAMNPMKLIGILRHGILSKSAAEDIALSIDSNGIACNGTDFVSVGISLGACMSTENGSFHFAIERDKLTTFIRGNPEQDMPFERQVHRMVPREAIKAIYLEKTGVLDLEHPQITLGVGFYNMDRARDQVRTYIDFMKKEFGHDLSKEDHAYLQETLDKMEHDYNDKDLDYFKKEKICMQHDRCIDVVLKKHLKLCYQKILHKDSITPYDIIRHYDKDIPILDFEGKDIHPVPAELVKLSM